MTYSHVEGDCYTFDQKIKLDKSLNSKNENLRFLMQTCIENNESKIVNEYGKKVCQGVSTEGALLSLGQSAINQGLVEPHKLTEIVTLHFTSERK